MDGKLSIGIKPVIGLNNEVCYLIQAFVGRWPIDYEYFNAYECRKDGESVEKHLLANAQEYYNYKKAKLSEV